jgi:hypothetical protein
VALPPAILTCTVTFGPFLDDVGVPFKGTVVFTSSRAKVWLATGTPILSRPVAVPLDEFGTGSITLPRTDQAGFGDGAGHAVTNWTYSATVQLDGAVTDVRVFQLPAGPTSVDLDLMTQVSSSQGILVDLPEVVSVAGLTGAISAADLAATLSGLVGGGSGTPDDGSVTDVKVATGAAISLDKTADSGTRVAMSAAERTKLGGVATGATANDTDANLKNRANHTGSQTSATISDLTEAVQDIVGAFFGAGTGASVTYNDAANTITVSATGTSDLEAVRDAIGVALVGVGVITVTVNDGADTITISSTATANSTDAALRDRSTHTGTQAQSTVTNLSTDLAARALKTEGLGVRVKSGGTWPGRPVGYASVLSIGDDPSPLDQVAGDLRWIPT